MQELFKVNYEADNVVNMLYSVERSMNNGKGIESAMRVYQRYDSV